MLFKFLILLCAMIFLAFTKVDGSDDKIEPFEINKISESLYVIADKDYGTNIGVLIGDNGIILIDPMPGEGRFKDLNALIKKMSDQPIKYVINTHGDEDHTGGNDFFKKRGAKIVSGAILESERKTDEITLSTSIKSDLINSGLEFAQVKSHSFEDLLIYHRESNALFVGDVFDNSWHPTFYAGGLIGLNSSINKIMSFSNESSNIVPGHGKTTNKHVVDAFRKNTVAWVRRVSDLHKTQLSVDEIMNDKQINALLQLFNTEKKANFIPQKAFRRFIERTITIVVAEQ